MRNDKIRDLAYMAIYAALFVVLWYVGGLIPLLVMPDGGSIQLELIALFLATFHIGWKKGLGVMFVGWLIVFLFGGYQYFVNPMQYALDYFVPLGICAVAELMALGNDIRYYLAIVIAMIIHWISNILSGVYFWFPEGTAAGSLPAWIYSLNYNTWYNLATMIVCLVIVPIMIARLKKSKSILFVK